MSKAAFCDRCGTFNKIPLSLLDSKCLIFKGGPGWQEVSLGYDINRDEHKSYSLCPSCSKEFNEFMKFTDNEVKIMQDVLIGGIDGR